MNLRSQINRLWRIKFLRDALYLYSGRAVNLIIGLGSVLIFGILFDTRQIAIISLFEMVVELFLSFGFTWSALGLVRFGKEEIIAFDKLNHTHSTRLVITFPILIISIMILLIFQKQMMAMIGSADTDLPYYLIVDIVFLVLHDHVTHLLTALEQHGRNAFFFLCQSVSRLMILAFFYTGIWDTSAELFLKATVMTQFLLVVVRIPHLRSRDIWPVALVELSDVRRYFYFVFPQIYGFVGLYVINWVDVYFIRQNNNMEDLGAYQFLYSIFTKICSFGILLNALFLPKIIEWKMNSLERLNQYLHKAPLAFFLSILLIMFLSIFIYPFVFDLFFDVKYAIAYPSFNILLLSVPFYFITRLLVPVFNSFDRVKYIQGVNIVTAALNLIVDYLFIPRYGLIAAACGTFFAYLLASILFLLSASRTHHTNYTVIYCFSGGVAGWVLLSIVR